jgi:tetratricopeptide (TPR) repeat protein/Fe-S-cluster-containing hydrogenase component 2
VLSNHPSHGQNAWTPGHPLIKHSNMGKWRAAVLVLVHVVMAAHIVQWLITGLTVSPVEPSESMYTLRDGTVNAGFVFFALAIVSTLVFGRFFCGWGCHIVAVQDLCGWAMMKLGVKPKPFRSRLLLLVPVGLAIYMFVWPVVVRDVVRPMLADSRGHLPDWMGQIDPLPGYRAAFLVQDFWATFAVWWMAIPFILACGVFTVYFLGAKAFCTYGCPYGGIFAPVDKISIGRIVVNDNCEHCGHCTAVCTSNVRVSEEVRDYGMVVDPGCMKCLDCVSVCPNEALSFAFAKPAVLVGVRPGAEASAAKAAEMRAARWDLSWVEEVICGVLFLALFWCYRGMFNQVPMLMAVAMGGVGAWACWKTWRLFIDANGRVHGFQLKFHGRIRAWGVAFALATVAWLGIAGWSGYVRWHLLQAQLVYQKLDEPIDIVLRPEFSPTAKDVANAKAALEHYRKVSAPGEMGSGGRGGVGYLWPLRPDEWLNIAYLRLVIGDWAGAEEASRRVLAKGHPRDAFVFQLSRVMSAKAARDVERMQYQGFPESETNKVQAGTNARIQEMFAGALKEHDDLFGVRYAMTQRRLQDATTPAVVDQSGQIVQPATTDAKKLAATKEAGIAEWNGVLDRHPRGAAAPLMAAMFFRDIGDKDRVKTLIDRALAARDAGAEQLLQAAEVLASVNEPERAAATALRAADAGMRLSGPRASAARVLADLGKFDDAAEQAGKAVEVARKKSKVGGESATLVGAGLLALRLDQSTISGIGQLSAEQLAARAKELGVNAEQPVDSMRIAVLGAERAKRKLDGMALIQESSKAFTDSAWELDPVGMQLLRMGTEWRRSDLVQEAVGLVERARDAEPEASAIRHDLAVAYYTAGRSDDAVKEMRKAAELAPTNAYLARRHADLLDSLGKVQEAAFWYAEAKRRGEAPEPKGP